MKALGIAGPTASGKSALALAIARRWPVEVISVDSALVYRGMDIGTAKPSAAEQALVPHHLIDLLAPTQAYSAARFVADARQLIGQINQRGRTALLVGGTMLYFKALIDGIDAMPAADPAVRAQLDARAATEGWPALHAELARVDPVTAARLPPLDAQRIQRALEVWLVSGRPISHWQRRDHPAGRGAADRLTDDDDGADRTVEPDAAASAADRAEGTVPGLALPLLSLEPQDRGWLHQRIAERFDAMLAAGLLDEVHRLRQRGDLSPGLPSMRCVGYRQAWAALDGLQPAAARPPRASHADADADTDADAGAMAAAPAQGLTRSLTPALAEALAQARRPGAADQPAWLATLRDTGVAATRQLAKRQLTWLRGMQRQVVACDAADALPQALAAAAALLDSPPAGHPATQPATQTTSRPAGEAPPPAAHHG